MPSLSQLYRPAHFSDITGQEMITETLRKEIASGKLGHAYLFCGPRGVGKTTSARVFAKALLCEKPADGEPCDECASCVAFQENKHFDVIELDAATHTGVDNVREAIIERVRFAPSLSQRKVFILDEVHMFSASSWNALLKTLEEPPAHAFFILATTEWHKVPATIISRCQRFEFKRVPNDVMAARVRALSQKEGWMIEDAVVSLIVAASDGCVRDAETLLGQLGALNQEKITLELASLIIPASHMKEAAKLMSLWVERKHAESLAETQRLFEQGLPFVPLFDDLLTIARQLLMYSGDATKVEVLKQGTEEDRAVAALVGRLSPGEIHDVSLVLMERRRDVKNGVEPLFALQLVGTLVANSLLKHSPSQIAPAPMSHMSPPQVQATRSQATASAEHMTVSSAPTPGAEQDAEPRYEELPSLKAVESVENESISPSVPLSDSSISLSLVQSKWLQIVKKIEEKNHSLPFILKLSRPEGLEGQVLMIRFQYPFHRDKVLNDAKHRRLVEDVLASELGVALRIDGIVGEEVAVAGEPKRQDMVSSILKAFGGQVVE